MRPSKIRKPRFLYWLTLRRVATGCSALALCQVIFLLLQGPLIVVQRTSCSHKIQITWNLLTSEIGFNTSYHQAAQQLAHFRDTYTPDAVNSSVGLVLASVRTDDLTWLLDYCRER